MIVARDLTKRYGSTVAVSDLSFEIRPGVVTGFLGPNGAGKSTTMRMIIGLDRPSAGSVRINGQSYEELRRPLHQVGAVLETGALHGGRSAYHHLLSLAQSNGIGKRRVDDVLDLVGLQDAAGRRAGTFSLGMRQRLGLAAALLGDPPVLLCDEPVNGLDPEGILWIRTLLRRLAAEGRTVFVSSHLMSEMAQTADRLIVLARGRLIADATTAEVIAGAAMTSVRVRTPKPGELRAALVAAGAHVSGTSDGLLVTGADAPDVGELAWRHGIPLHHLSTEQASLEEAFMELTRGDVEFRAAEVAAK
jgi:ABC-2 type transport system ATP-binding protein